jgi:3-hydroxyisobutyrate dehydrogenase-like beta-hydroxyacid dehydrogenase
MGAAVGAQLVIAGHTVLWASEGRSAATASRAEKAGLVDAGGIAGVAARSDVVLSICPPAAAVAVARAASGIRGIYVDANAISPVTAAEVAMTVLGHGAVFVDGGLIGPPPAPDVNVRLYLSGSEAPAIATLFAGTQVTAVILDGAETSASALKLAYASWSKGSLALLLATKAFAESLGVSGVLAKEWAYSLPELGERVRFAEAEARRKGWRWTGEMREIAAAMAAQNLPPGFHEAASEIYARASRSPRPEINDAAG